MLALIYSARAKQMAKGIYDIPSMAGLEFSFGHGGGAGVVVVVGGGGGGLGGGRGGGLGGRRQPSATL